MRTRKGICMSWNFLISFAVAVGLYLLVILIVGFIKRHKNKNKEKKDDNIEGDNE